jgi:EAL domain-containing protein (putative c-di-GMP-specific phosphodiesterase class I)
LGAEIGNALKRGEFEVHYQPIVNVRGSVIGAEALVRWRHPTKGLLMPCDIIPVAVESGLIVSIGRWVLFEACQQVKRWSRIRELFVTINMTASEFLDSHMLESVRGAVTRSGIRPSQIKLEITESESMENPQEAIDRIMTLQRAGIDVLIDDFGTGQSSLSYLRNLPARILKLDQAFTPELGDPHTGHAFLGHVIGAMKSLSKTVVLEGIQSIQQARIAARLKCDLMQGDYFGAAQSAASFERLLHKGCPKESGAPASR